MTIDLSEPLIPLGDVPSLPYIPRRRHGGKLSVSTVWRWALRGLRGHKLETVRVGDQLCTSRTALLEFFRAGAPDMGGPSAPQTSRQRRHASERASAEVDAILS